MGDATVSYKARGNEEYAKRNFLKAAALYTHGLQADPKNATLYSNRSAALLNLNKVTKALADAEACISLRPDWDKGYFRKGLALEAAGKGQEDGEEDFSAVDAVADPLAEDPSLPSLSTPVDEAGGEGAGTSSRLGRPPQQRPGPLPAALKKGRLLDHEGQAVAPSIVPDHVRHPERYMRYTFDQEIQVGGGVAQLAESATTQVSGKRSEEGLQSAWYLYR
ncbi:STIP1-like protein [Auxenochlorella protothecoides]|uniref:STIP1-like protein n=1 Tax=Auxenochlorella protothecoides TaxID=3075 RepID=A0A087SEC3_AUXPR|nr:STIP1-like protein [Auxenochlorella protothecoides]KFM24077.1 STIP1-like protein [Auxenochlorella protothecoides]